MDIATTLKELQDRCHQASYDAGWWHHAETGLPYIPGDKVLSSEGSHPLPWFMIDKAQRDLITHYWPITVACKIALIHSEVSEAMEAHRKGLMDDKLVHRLGMETEISDAMIRQFDIAGAMTRAATLGIVTSHQHDMNIGTAFIEKMTFNATRPDHKITVRLAQGGKKY